MEDYNFFIFVLIVTLTMVKFKEIAVIIHYILTLECYQSLKTDSFSLSIEDLSQVTLKITISVTESTDLFFLSSLTT